MPLAATERVSVGMAGAWTVTAGVVAAWMAVVGLTRAGMVVAELDVAETMATPRASAWRVAVEMAVAGKVAVVMAVAGGIAAELASGGKVAVALAGGEGVAAQIRTVARVSGELAIAVDKGVAELMAVGGVAVGTAAEVFILNTRHKTTTDSSPQGTTLIPWMGPITAQSRCGLAHGQAIRSHGAL